MKTSARHIVRYDARLVAEDMAERGWINTDLARATGLSDWTISRWMNGIRRTPRTTKAIALALGYPTSRYILRASNRKPAA